MSNSQDQRPPPALAVLGRNARATRQHRGALQDDVARAMRVLGFPWRRSTVAAMEAGKRDLGLEELIGLCHALGKPLAALLDHDEPVGFAGDALGPSALQATLTEGTALPPYGATGRRQIRETLEVYDELVVRAAARLGRAPAEVDQASVALWGRVLGQQRSVEEGRAQLHADPRTLQAKRGHITRGLIAALRQHFDSQESADGW